MNSLSLHVRLAAALLTLLLVAGSVNLTAGILMSRQYLDEVEQMSNRDLASGIAQAKHQNLVAEDGRIRQSGLDEVLHWMMVVHPGPHFYLLDLRGEIIAFDPAAGDPVLSRVALAPVREFLDREHRRSKRVDPQPGPERPLLGDDPRSPDQQAIFSVSPLPAEGEPVGYLYIVLRPKSVQTMAESLRGSYILQLGVRNTFVYLLVTVVLGLLVFYGLTRPLRKLAVRVDQINLDPEDDSDDRAAPAVGDEVKRLEDRFEAMSQRLSRYVEESQKIDQLRRELFANLSHDLRTPIATLRGYLETLALGSDSLTPEQRSQYVAIALRHSERLSRLVDELLELAKLDSHTFAPNLERFQIAELIQDNVQRFRLRALKQEVDLRAELNPNLPSVSADVGLMERALENLIGNALQHTDPGGSIAVGVRPAQNEGRLRISVADTGSGISPEDLPFIFERFVGSPSANKTPGSGSSTGLGLAITRRIAELHQSELWVETEVGVGTTFSFELDIAPQTHSTRLTRITRRTLNWVDSLTKRGQPTRETGDQPYRPSM